MFPELLLSILCVVGAAAVRYHQRSKRQIPLTPSIALVTGASGGIGRELALQLIERTTRRTTTSSSCCLQLLILSGRNVKALEDTASRCRQALGGAEQQQGAKTEVIIVPGSLDSLESTAAYVAAVDAALQSWSATTRSRKGTTDAAAAFVDFVVLNAGQGAIVPFPLKVGGGDSEAESQHYLEVVQNMMQVNFLSNVQLLQYFLPRMESTTSGRRAAEGEGKPCHVLVVSSLAGVFPSTLRSAYTASKHALQGFVNALRGELQSTKVTVVCPGYVDTAFHKVAADAAHVTSSTSGGAATTRKHSMSPRECASQALDAAATPTEMERILTTVGWVGYRLRPWLPRWIDRKSAAKSYESVGKKVDLSKSF